MKIKCEYLDGTTREFSDQLHAKVLCKMLKEIKSQKGIMYNKVVNSPLSKIYVDGELVLDREKVMGARK